MGVSAWITRRGTSDSRCCTTWSGSRFPRLTAFAGASSSARSRCRRASPCASVPTALAQSNEARQGTYPTAPPFFAARARSVRLLLALERSQHVADAGPRAHQLDILAEPKLHHAIEQLDLLRNLRSDGCQLGARARMLAPPFARRRQRPLELIERRRQHVEHLRRHA